MFLSGADCLAQATVLVVGKVLHVLHNSYMQMQVSCVSWLYVLSETVFAYVEHLFICS